MLESLSRELNDPYQDQHFQDTLDDVRKLEKWLSKKKIKNNWSMNEKLAFLRNVETTIRTGAAVRRTQLAWFALVIGSVAAILGLLIGISK